MKRTMMIVVMATLMVSGLFANDGVVEKNRVNPSNLLEDRGGFYFDMSFGNGTRIDTGYAFNKRLKVGIEGTFLVSLVDNDLYGDFGINIGWSPNVFGHLLTFNTMLGGGIYRGLYFAIRETITFNFPIRTTRQQDVYFTINFSVPLNIGVKEYKSLYSSYRSLELITTRNAFVSIGVKRYF